MTKIVFLQKNSHFNLNNKVDIILCPSLYWCKVFDIPIDSMSEVNNVVGSFFEDFFDISSYKFFVIKQDKHKYLCFAYIENDIVNAIKNANIEFKNIKNIYFAQNELSSIMGERFYNINTSIYAKKDNIIVNIPKSLAKNIQSKELYFDNINLSKYKIYINQSSKYIDIKTAYILSFIFIIFSIINFSKTISLKNEIKFFENKKNELKQKYELPLTNLQTKSIINEYKNIKKQYLDFISKTEYLLNFSNNINGKLIEFNYTNKIITMKFDKKNKDLIEKYINKKYKIISKSISSNYLVIKVKI